MLPKNQNFTLIAAIIFAALIVSGSLIFFALQLRPPNLEQVVQEGIESYIQKQAANSQKVAEEEKNKQAATVKPVSASDHVRGNPEARVSIIEYSDFECPYCKRFHATPPEIIAAYDGKVSWVYRHFPLAFHDPAATNEAEGAECANELGGNEAFWQYADGIFEKTAGNGKGLSQEELVSLAVELDLDSSSFSECLESDKYIEHIQTDVAEGSTAGVTGTPGNIILNNKTGEARLLAGAYPLSAFQEIIDEML